MTAPDTARSFSKRGVGVCAAQQVIQTDVVKVGKITKYVIGDIAPTVFVITVGCARNMKRLSNFFLT